MTMTRRPPLYVVGGVRPLRCPGPTLLQAARGVLEALDAGPDYDTTADALAAVRARVAVLRAAVERAEAE